MNTAPPAPASPAAAIEPPLLAELERVLEQHGPRGQTVLLEVLHDAQAMFGGWLPAPAVERIGEYLGVPVADVYGVTEFYEMFHTEPVGRKLIRVCQDGPCAVAGAAKLTGRDRPRGWASAPARPPPTARTRSKPVRCLGLCDRAPAALVNLRAPRARRGRDAARRAAAAGPAEDRRPGQDRAGERRRGRSDQPGRLPRAGRHVGVCARCFAR